NDHSSPTSVSGSLFDFIYLALPFPYKEVFTLNTFEKYKIWTQALERDFKQAVPARGQTFSRKTVLTVLELTL
ncbi:hypothetical protein STEG23_020285, partial [Scotinomys teguina]